MVRILSRTAERGKKTLELVATGIAQPESVVRASARTPRPGPTESLTFK